MRVRALRSVLLIACLSAFAQGYANPGTIAGRVMYVADGDTIGVFVPSEKKLHKIRLSGIDCPEVGHRGKPDQDFGRQATEFAKQRVDSAWVEVDISETDRYGRGVGRVFFGERADLNAELVEAGYAWWYDKYARLDALLSRLEAEARHEQRGLWQDPDPTPPWVFRHLIEGKTDRLEDWKANKCELESHRCPNTPEPTQCRVEVTVGKNTATFKASGGNECVATRLLEYQICRGRLERNAGHFVCGESVPARIGQPINPLSIAAR